MRLSSLCVAAVLLLPSIALAQHSSGGGGGSSGGSSGGGGGSHGGSSGGSSFSSSSSSGSSHSSGGGSGSSAHASGHSSVASSAASHSGPSNSRTANVHSGREPNAAARSKTETTGKRGFFSLLRHPFRKPEPKPKPPKVVADLRRPVCFKGPCPVCPTGQSHVGGSCTGTALVSNPHRYCSSREIWNGGDCVLQTRFLDDCAGLRNALQQQAQRMQSSELERQNACATGQTQGCADSTNAAQSESGLYRTLQDRYRQCTQRSMTAYPIRSFAIPGYSAGMMSEPLEMGLSFP